MRSVSKYVAFAVVALLITACGRGDNVRKNESLAHLSSTRAAPAKKTACVSFQGNGVYFSSHIGALIALLENNYEPVFATGGSSGAIIAGLARALVENPSLADGRGFSPQEAAVVLAASAPVIESVLFLPRFTTPLLLLDSLDVFLTGSSMGVLSAEPNDGLVNAESIVGQSTLVIDFYRTADFSEIFSMGSVREREFELARMWKKYANTVDVTPEDAADALLTSRETLEGQGRADLVEIQDRIFKLYRSKKDTFHRNWKTQQDSWNRLIGGNARAFSRRLLKKCGRLKVSTHLLQPYQDSSCSPILIAFIVPSRDSIRAPTAASKFRRTPSSTALPAVPRKWMEIGTKTKALAVCIRFIFQTQHRRLRLLIVCFDRSITRCARRMKNFNHWFPVNGLLWRLCLWGLRSQQQLANPQHSCATPSISMFRTDCDWE
jgi:hypothetical protein